ncbi:hypothetical protein Vadar_021596 [Vaccinium darrowii]|uniref:Uncharacterized protein n=1 Tax=Vaccinium darrowii TaxID=229202 RepID=A0ACB7Y898_9ERIC|nr:hypothetical protein Vadar_021596 [Vaccinium darrowii]
MPPAPPRVYKVDSSNFKQLVQKLTAAPEFQPRRLKSITPPPLTSPSTSKTVDAGKQSTSTGLELLPPPVAGTEVPVSMREKRKIIQPAWKQTDGLASTKASLMGFSISPLSLKSHLWWSFPLLSPGTISSMEQGAVIL